MQTRLLAFFTHLLFPILLAGQSLLISPMSQMPDQGRDDAVGFSINGTGYIIGGRKADFVLSPQVWAYHPSTDSWEQKADFPGMPRQYATAFVLNGFAHIIGGLADPGIELSEHWLYDHHSDIWTQLNDFPGGGRFAACAFLYRDEVYFGTGRGEGVTFKGLWSYDADSYSWNPAAEFPFPVYGALSCAAGDEVFVSGGILQDESISDAVWQFDGEGFIELNKLPTATANSDLIQVSGRNLMVGGRLDLEDATSTILELRASSLTSGMQWNWDLRDESLASGRRNAAAFSIDGIGYYFGGKDVSGIKSNELTRFSWSVKDAPAVTVHPNPSNAGLTINSDDLIHSFSIFDPKGARLSTTVLNTPIQTITVSREHLESGLHFLQVDDAAAIPFIISR